MVDGDPDTDEVRFVEDTAREAANGTEAGDVDIEDLPDTAIEPLDDDLAPPMISGDDELTGAAADAAGAGLAMPDTSVMPGEGAAVEAGAESLEDPRDASEEVANYWKSTGIEITDENRVGAATAMDAKKAFGNRDNDASIQELFASVSDAWLQRIRDSYNPAFLTARRVLNKELDRRRASRVDGEGGAVEASTESSREVLDVPEEVVDYWRERGVEITPDNQEGAKAAMDVLKGYYPRNVSTRGILENVPNKWLEIMIDVRGPESLVTREYQHELHCSHSNR
jgi:hypothetical protein